MFYIFKSNAGWSTTRPIPCEIIGPFAEMAPLGKNIYKLTYADHSGSEEHELPAPDDAHDRPPAELDHWAVIEPELASVYIEAVRYAKNENQLPIIGAVFAANIENATLQILPDGRIQIQRAVEWLGDDNWAGWVCHLSPAVLMEHTNIETVAAILETDAMQPAFTTNWTPREPGRHLLDFENNTKQALVAGMGHVIANRIINKPIAE